MGKFSCFPTFAWRCSTKALEKQNASENCTLSCQDSNAAKIKILNAKVWPGDDFPSKLSELRSQASADEHVTWKSEPPEATQSLTEVISGSVGPDSSGADPRLYNMKYEGESSSVSSAERYSLSNKQDENSSSETSTSLVGGLLDTMDGECVPNREQESSENGEEDVERVSSAYLKHVEDWVKNLDELPNDKPTWAQEATRVKEKETFGAEGEAETNELNGLVVKSLSPLAVVANLSGIGMKGIPFLGAFNNLRSLSLSGNSIAKIAPGCLPKSLHFLDLSRNTISTIEGLRGLTRLRILNLSYNRLSRIGHGLGNCASIRELYLAGNKISEIEGLHRLRKLYLLDLSNNRLATTKSLGQLAANYNCLQALNLLGNPVLVNLGEEQLRRFISAISPHLTYLNKQPIKPVHVREAVLGKFERTALGTSNHHSRKSARSGSKAKRVESLRRTHGGRRKHF